MRKVNKMLMATVSILLCLVLISTSVVSGIYAKFVITETGNATVSLKAFGITLKVKQGYDKPSGAIVTPTTINANTVSVKVENIKMIPPQSSNDKNYDSLIMFELSGKSNVPKVKLTLTVEFEGVNNFNIPANTVLDANHTITTGGNYLPFAFYAYFSGSSGNTLDYWRNPESDDKLEADFVNAIRADKTIGNKFSEDENTEDNSIEAIICNGINSSPSIHTIYFGYLMYIDIYKTNYTKEGAHPAGGIEAHAMQTYLANKNPAPTFSATYTISIEQVID